MNQLTFLSEAHRASHSQSPDCEAVSPTLEAGSCLPTLKSLDVTGLDGLSGRMSPVSCHQDQDGILVPSSGRWGSWGMGSHTECWTLNGSEWPSDAAVCSLSDVLETQPLPPRFSLSARASAGILRRAQKRGKALPPMLRQALEQAATGTGATAPGR